MTTKNPHQCEHTEFLSRRSRGRRCRRRAEFKAWISNGEGSGVFCNEHAAQRAAPGVHFKRVWPESSTF